MSWQLLIALSVLLFSINGLLHRILMKHDASDAYAQTVAFCGLVCITALIIAVFRGGLHMFFSFNQLLLFVPSVILGALGSICAFKGFKHIEASEHTILLTSSRIWFIAGTLLILREAFSWQKLIGGILIIIGVSIAQWRKGKFVLNAGAIYVLLAALFYAGSDLLSFLIIRNFDAISYVVYSTAFAVVLLLIIRPSTIQKLSFYRKPKRLANIVIVSVNDAFASLFAFLAYQTGRNALQIGPLGATQTIVTVFLALIFLGETDHMAQKIAGAITVVVGTFILL